MGPPPKNPAQRARRNKGPELRDVSIVATEPYDLPDDLLPAGEEWHPATLRWWRSWCESPLAQELPENDWRELEATAVLHHEFMKKRNFALGSELRLRMQAFGATPLDRQRLRIAVSTADEKDAGKPKPVAGGSARERFGNLDVVS
jgi:hypothetical protein